MPLLHPVNLSYAAIAVLWSVSIYISIPYYLHLLLLVTCILVAGCHQSLHLRHEPPPGATPAAPKDVMSSSEAYQFPIVGSLSLFSLYLAFKFLDKDLVNLLIGIYFGAMGCVAISMTLAPFIPIQGKSFGRNILIPHSLTAILGPSPLDLSFQVTPAEGVAFIIAIITCSAFFMTKLWFLNNVLGIAFCLQALERFSLGTYQIGAILLAGLFLYDIFWVFGTDVMVTVAKSLDGPIKLLFPRGTNAETGKLELSLLGLGDIVIPGFFLALLLRFDARHSPKHPINITDNFPKPYFYSTLIGYVLGLITTLVVMTVFNAAQPALLYLVPACLGTSFGCALWRGEVKELLAYSEDEEEEKSTKEQQKQD